MTYPLQTSHTNNDINTSILSLASIGCTPDEIIAELDLTIPTIEFIQTFGDIIKKGLLKYNVSIRKAQMKLLDKDPGLSRWLGTVSLGQDSIKPKDDNVDLSREELLRKLMNVVESKDDLDNANVGIELDDPEGLNVGIVEDGSKA